MASGKLAVQRLSDTIAHELERRILDGALKPGEIGRASCRERVYVLV